MITLFKAFPFSPIKADFIFDWDDPKQFDVVLRDCSVSQENQNTLNDAVAYFKQNAQSNLSIEQEDAISAHIEGVVNAVVKIENR